MWLTACNGGCFFPPGNNSMKTLFFFISCLKYNQMGVFASLYQNSTILAQIFLMLTPFRSRKLKGQLEPLSEGPGTNKGSLPAHLLPSCRPLKVLRNGFGTVVALYVIVSLLSRMTL